MTTGAKAKGKVFVKTPAGITPMRSLYDNVKAVTSLEAQADTGGSEVDGLAVDTFGYNTAVAHFHSTVTTSNPSVASIAVAVQQSADGSTNWTAVSGATATLDVHTVKAGAQIRLEGLNNTLKRYLRVSETTSFTGGTSPAVSVYADIILGRAFQNPTN